MSFKRLPSRQLKSLVSLNWDVSNITLGTGVYVFGADGFVLFCFRFCAQLKSSQSTRLLTPFLQPILESLLAMATQFTEDVLSLVLESLRIVMSVSVTVVLGQRWAQGSYGSRETSTEVLRTVHLILGGRGGGSGRKIFVQFCFLGVILEKNNFSHFSIHSLYNFSA